MIRRTFFAAVCLACALTAAPRLTTIQDMLYKADGTRFNGTLTISWSGFQSADSATIMTQSTTVKVVDGNLRVQLVPSPVVTPANYYSVIYNSDGRVQFQEMWSVPTSNQPVRVRDVRVAAAPAGADTGGATGGPIPEADIVGLLADLDARPLKGAALAAGRVAFVDALGAIDSVSGNASDCVHVDGSSGPCGASSTTFVDGDSPIGIVDGSNTTFKLSNPPNPAGSLAIYRNGMLQKAGSDYAASGDTVQFAAPAAPQAGDTLLASYRLGGSSSGTAQFYPQPQVLCSGSGTATGATAMTAIGACSIPAGTLSAGDRVEIHFDLAHTGTSSGFTFEVDWAATPILSRSASSADVLVSGRAEAALLSSGAQLSAQSWGTALSLDTAVGAAPDSFSSGITVNFQGKLSQTGDTLTLAHYTVMRLP